MIGRLRFAKMQDYQMVFRIGLFLPYRKSDMTAWNSLRDHLRKNGFPSAFLVKDYLTDPFENERKKSFYFLRNCHTAFFIIEGEVGKGGVVSELEEYIREVYPNKNKISVLFEKCDFKNKKIVDAPSSVIKPILTEEKFYVRRFTSRDELPSMTLGMARSIFYKMLKTPQNLIDIPEYRLRCQVCNKVESVYICKSPCSDNCEKIHLCESCYNSTCGKTDNICALPY